MERVILRPIEEKTQQLYKPCFEEYSGFCSARGTAVFTDNREVAAVLMLNFLISCAKRGLGPRALQLRRAAIRRAYLQCGYPDPGRHHLIVDYMRAAFRTSKRQRTQPVDADDVRALLDACAPQYDHPMERLRSLRNRALILLCFLGPLRRAQIRLVRAENLLFTPTGVAIGNVRKDGRPLVVHRKRRDPCPVSALEEWLAAARIAYGPVFRGVGDDGRIRVGSLAPVTLWRVFHAIYRRAGVAGAGTLPLTIGFRTCARAAGISPAQIMRQAEISSDALAMYEPLQWQMPFPENPLGT